MGMRALDIDIRRKKEVDYVIEKLNTKDIQYILIDGIFSGLWKLQRSWSLISNIPPPCFGEIN